MKAPFRVVTAISFLLVVYPSMVVAGVRQRVAAAALQRSRRRE
jgi:hypothetical protein